MIKIRAWCSSKEPSKAVNSIMLWSSLHADDAHYRWSWFFLLLHLNWQLAPVCLRANSQEEPPSLPALSYFCCQPHMLLLPPSGAKCQLQSTICKKAKCFDSQSLQLLQISKQCGVELIHQSAADNTAMKRLVWILIQEVYLSTWDKDLRWNIYNIYQ